MPRTSDAKERLLKAALDLMWESSYGATSVDVICERSDVRKGSFYYFFKSKSDLAVAALEEDWNSKQSMMDEIFDPATPPLDRLRSFFENSHRCQSQIKKETGAVLGCPLFSLGCEVSTKNPEIRAKIEEIMGRYRSLLESALRDMKKLGELGGDESPKKLAERLFAYFEGTLMEARIKNSLTPLKNFADEAVRFLGIQEPATV